jgi:hypothetical protein
MLGRIDFWEHVVRDMQQLCESESGRLPGLRNLSFDVLGCSVEMGEHSSVEDERATMGSSSLYREKYRAGCAHASEAFDLDESSAQVEADGRCDSLASDSDVCRRTDVDGL